MTYPVFASGDVLNASDMNAVGSWLVKTQTIGTAVSTVTVTGAFSSDYDNYLVTIIGGAASATPSYCDLTLGSTTTGYYMSEIYGKYDSNTLNMISRANHTAFIGGGYSTSNIATSFRIFGPNLAKTTHFITEAPIARTAGDNWSYCLGYLNNTTQYTAFTLSMVGGTTLTGGTIRVYGLRN